MKATLLTHYKERDPQDTVNILKGFFESLGPDFKITRPYEYHKDGMFHTIHIDLWYKDLHIHGSNGKGFTKEYCEASAYAELYERFCGGWAFPYTYPDMGLPNSDMECTDWSKYSDSFSEEYVSKTYALLPKYLYKSNGGTYFKNLQTGEKSIFDYRIVEHINGTNGLAAGNTETEALVQAISEICERWALYNVYQNDLVVHRISDELLQRECPESYKRIKELESEDVSMTFFDCSSIGYPVIASICTIKNAGQCYLCFGACPSFQIAIERCITETFQGREVEHEDGYVEIAPCNKFTSSDMITALCTGMTGFPDKMFDYDLVSDSINYNIFCSSDFTNEQMLERLISLLNEHDVTVYWKDISIIKDMHAVCVFSPQFTACNNTDVFSNMPASAKIYEDFFNIMNKEEISYADKFKIRDMTTSVFASPLLCELSTGMTKETEKYISKWLGAIINYSLGNYQMAHQEITAISPINHTAEHRKCYSMLRVFLNYKVANLDNEEILHRLKIYHLDEDLLRIIADNGQEFLDLYIKKLICGTAKDFFDFADEVVPIIKQMRVDNGIE